MYDAYSRSYAEAVSSRPRTSYSASDSARYSASASYVEAAPPQTLADLPFVKQKHAPGFESLGFESFESRFTVESALTFAELEVVEAAERIVAARAVAIGMPELSPQARLTFVRTAPGAPGRGGGGA
jgi:hypothetical protein